MDHNDRQAIEGLFGKLAQVQRQQPHRDPEAEALIADTLARQPGAAYYLAQTVLVQEQALNAAQQRLEELERAPARTAPAQPQGGLFGRVFGGGAAAQPQPRAAQPTPQGYGQQAQPGPWASGGRPAGGGGFLAGAAQTAMGVAGGVLLGNAIGGMFGGGAAEAGEMDPGAAEAEEEPGLDDGGFDDGGWEE